MTISAPELAEELMEIYRGHCGLPSRSLDAYVMLGDAPAVWREARALAGQYGRTIHDLFSTCLRAGMPPLPVTALSIEAACKHLQQNGMDPKIRRGCWTTAVRSLPTGRPDLADPDLVKPAAPIRRKNAPAGTFPNVERGLAAWKAQTCMPMVTPFEERIRRTEGTADGMIRHLLCAATSLRDLGRIKMGATLEELLEATTFDAWLQNQGDESPASLLVAIEAFAGVSADKADKKDDDPTVIHIRSQKAGRRDANKLPEQGLVELCSMLDDPRRAELVPIALMLVANSNDLPDRTRLKLANLAPAMHLAIDYALMPTEVFSAEHDEEFNFHPPVRLRKAAVLPLPSRRMHAVLLRQRWAIREALGAAPTRRLMTTFAGEPMDSKGCAQALDRTQRHFGLIAHPWQRFRDFAAGRMLIEDPSDLKRVADLLQVKNPALVELRYREVIPRSMPARRGVA